MTRGRAHACARSVGEDIAIITVHLRRARVCDVNDRVSHFQRTQSGREWTECTH